MIPVYVPECRHLTCVGINESGDLFRVGLPELGDGLDDAVTHGGLMGGPALTGWRAARTASAPPNQLPDHRDAEPRFIRYDGSIAVPIPMKAI